MKIRYTESIVLFLDVLGFSNLVYSKDKTKIEDYFSYVQSDFRKYLSERKFNYIIISDSIVVTTKKTKENLSELIFVIGKIQYQLFLKGILLRGAISFGKLYFNKPSNIIVGPGLIKAYKLESTAKYPRVIIDRQIIPELFDSTLAFVDYLNRHYNDLYGEKEEKIKFDNTLKDGKPYINFMRKVVRYGSTYQLKNIQNIIALFSSNYFQNEYFEKYNWLLEELKAELSLGIIHYEKHLEFYTSKARLTKIKFLQAKVETI
jgi:hypothetical protein